MNRAVFPGTFDPITLGHVDIIKRALPLFDEVIIAIGINANKQTMFSLEERITFIEKTFSNNPKIKVSSYSGLTVRFCQEQAASFLIRGLRNSTDFTYEMPLSQANYKLAKIETVFLLSSPEVSFITSSIVRDIRRNNGNIEELVPEAVI